jgi:hypothetical protein
MIPDAFPLLVHKTNHPAFIPDRAQPSILR